MKFGQLKQLWLPDFGLNEPGAHARQAEPLPGSLVKPARHVHGPPLGPVCPLAMVQTQAAILSLPTEE